MILAQVSARDLADFAWSLPLPIWVQPYLLWNSPSPDRQKSLSSEKSAPFLFKQTVESFSLVPSGVAKGKIAGLEALFYEITFSLSEKA